MPKQARIDAPGALYQVIWRGTNRQKMFLEEDDYTHTG